MTLHLGIDIGTTKVSAAIASADLSTHFYASRSHHADLSAGPDRAEQDFAAIEAALAAVLGELPSDSLAAVASVGISCQMHSVALRRDDGALSPVVTWQDRRTEGEVGEMSARCGRRLFPGYGGATLAHFAAAGKLEGWDGAATPADLLVASLTGGVTAMSRSLAAPWGLYDARTRDWDFAAIDRLGIPRRFFPRIVPDGTVVGTTLPGHHGIPGGIPVIAPIGDNQASILGCGGDPETDLFATVGTGSQLSAVVPEEAAAALEERPGLDFRPFTRGRVLVAVPPLSGGRGLAVLADAVADVLAVFGAAAPKEGALLDRLDALALAAPADAGGIRFIPDFAGSRVRPGSFASIEGITPANFTLANVARALFNGIVANLFGPMPREIVRSKRRVACSGNAIAKCATLRRALEEASGLPIFLPALREEAATGAALLGAEAIGTGD